MQLSNDEIRRYSRHLILPEVGMAGQKKICATSVLCIGAGGLGSPIAMYLAAAGVGKIGLVDFDTVDFSNLQRQIIHSTADVGRLKGESAKETIQGINQNLMNPQMPVVAIKVGNTIAAPIKTTKTENRTCSRCWPLKRHHMKCTFAQWAIEPIHHIRPNIKL